MLLEARAASARTMAETESDLDLSLKLAAGNGALQIAKELLLYGADPNRLGCYDTPRAIDRAVYAGQYEVACLLLEQGAEVIGSSSSSSIHRLACSAMQPGHLLCS
jgi:ankyrin repeat protein